MHNSTPILCNDIIFKSLFIDMEELLKRFIYDITGYKLHNITLEVNEIPITRKNEKFKRCDLIIKSENIIFNIELNSMYYKSLIVKNLSYICGLLSKNTSKGDNYNEDLEVIQININNFSRFNKPVLDYQITNNSYGIVYFRGLRIYDLDIVKCNNLYYNERIRKRNYLRWGALFSSHTLENMIPILDELLGIRMEEIVMAKLKKMTVVTHVMDEAEALREDDKIRRSIRQDGLEEGIEKGIEKGRFETTINMIKNMIDNSASFEFISKVTGKSIKEIDSISKSM